MNLKRKLFTYILLELLTLISVKSQSFSISNSLNQFAINLLSTTKETRGCPPNVAISPFNIWTLLSIINEGAKENTAAQLERVLGIPNTDKKIFHFQFQNMSQILTKADKDVSLDIFNKIYTSSNFKLNETFRKTTESNFGVSVEPINFESTKSASDTINKFVSQATKNRIPTLVGPADLLDAQVFLLSTLYFKGAWQSPFNTSSTRVESFYDEKENKLGDVNMMYQMGFFPFTRLDHLKGYALELPYSGGDKMSMILILPYKHETVASMLQEMKKHPFEKVLADLDTAKEDFEGEDVKVYIPQFKVDSDLNMNVVLSKMGITDVFDYSKANLLGMFPHYLYLSKIIQKAEIEVTEEGTIASAAAGGTLANKSTPPKFLANKPFLYFIVNKVTRSIVFEGVVAQPPQSPSKFKLF